jgi:hypothetical protein
MAAKPSREGVMENDKQQAQAQLRGRRTLMVSTLYRQWGGAHQKNECSVPSIRLNGKWLAALGFASGQKVRVVTNGSIITIAQHSRPHKSRVGLRAAYFEAEGDNIMTEFTYEI